MAELNCMNCCIGNFKHSLCDCNGEFCQKFKGIGREDDFIKKVMSEPERKKGEWIPCSERLPEEDGLYLVTTSKGQTQVHVFNHNGNSEKYWMRCNKAWMPLPKPYKE